MHSSIGACHNLGSCDQLISAGTIKQANRCACPPIQQRLVRPFFALSVPLWIRSRWLGAAAAGWTLLAICSPLLHLGDHWASDIFAGAAFGVALMLLLCRLIDATTLPGRVVRFSASHPPAFYAIASLVSLEIAVRFGHVEAFFSDVARLTRALLY